MAGEREKEGGRKGYEEGGREERGRGWKMKELEREDDREGGRHS